VTLTVSKLLFEKFLEYQKKSGERKTLKDFAEHIGVGQVHLNRLMNGRRNAGEKTIAMLADFFDDFRFYDAAGLPRPDPRLQTLIKNWGTLSEDARKKISDEIGNYTTK
jgi:transcriptional regulator with XRE-family HTH domain